MSEGGSKQLREYRIARRDGADRTEACAASGICEAEARLIDAEDAKNPPSDACYVRLGAPAVEQPEPRSVVVVGDCRETMRAMPDCSVDAIVCDPPYELGFMGKSWDATGIAYDVGMWSEALRVLKPGGHLLAFSGSRTYHRMVVAIEDAGFQIRDQLMWIYGSGFPKSLDVSKAIDKAAGAEREVVGIDQRYVGMSDDAKRALGGKAHESSKGFAGDPSLITAPATPDAARWSGWGTALKPAHEPICMARKPLIGTVAQNVLEWGTGGINVDGCRVEGEAWKHPGSNAEGGIYGDFSNDGARVGNPAGRFPANVLHDGSDEVVEHFPETKTGSILPYESKSNGYEGGWGKLRDSHHLGDSGSAARFFYSAKASRADREAGLTVSEGRGNVHPTVKPTDVMRWLVRMITPPGGLVLDPFTGSGSTGRAAMLEGMRFVGCELSEEYAEIARARIADAAAQADAPPKPAKRKAARKPRAAKIVESVQGSLF